MPRPRGSTDVPRRLSSRTPLHLKTTACSEANGVHKTIVEPSPKSEERRSPRSPLLDVVKKKGGTRVVELETKLGKAQEELKKLRDQLASAEAAKVDAEQALEKAKKQIPVLDAGVTKEHKEEKSPKDVLALGTDTTKESIGSEVATDVFEVVVPKFQLEDYEDECENKEMEEKIEVEAETKKDDGAADDVIVGEVEMKTDKEVEENIADNGGKQEEVVTESSEVVELKSKLLEKEKEVEILQEENAIFKAKAKEEFERVDAAARAKEEELVAKLRLLEEELKESRMKTEQLGEQLKATEIAKSSVETDMKRLKVQTEQWRKAAEAAAAVIAGGDGAGGGGRRVAERCGSMDKNLSSGVGGYASWGSPLMDEDLDDDGVVGGGGRRKAGIRMFGDLWKKKGQQK